MIFCNIICLSELVITAPVNENGKQALTARRVSLLAGSLTHVLNQGSSNREPSDEKQTVHPYWLACFICCSSFIFVLRVDVRLGLLWQECFSRQNRFLMQKTKKVVSCANVRLGLLWQRYCLGRLLTQVTTSFNYPTTVNKNK